MSLARRDGVGLHPDRNRAAVSSRCSRICWQRDSGLEGQKIG